MPSSTTSEASLVTTVVATASAVPAATLSIFSKFLTIKIKCCLISKSNMENMTPNLYDAIGVSAEASSDEIKKKTRKLMNEVRQSDKRNSEKNELLRFFKSVRETLCDSSQRERYDGSIGIETAVKEEDQSCVPFDSSFGPMQPFGVRGVLGSLGSLLSPMETAPSRSPASTLLSLVGSDMHSMFSNSIVPEELSLTPGGLKPGTFQILEYTKVRNPGGGFDEFGFTRQGDMQNDRVTEKRFERKS